ncbi:exported hypothetical protein [Clostridium neonatale]|nr:exported hypothetical protein [Clostridium neonatale]CAI3617810.1 exported hypothetical protein [Clostridium neonatale]
MRFIIFSCPLICSPIKKNVAFTSSSLNISNISVVTFLAGPSSNVKYITFDLDVLLDVSSANAKIFIIFDNMRVKIIILLKNLSFIVSPLRILFTILNKNIIKSSSILEKYFFMV